MKVFAEFNNYRIAGEYEEQVNLESPLIEGRKVFNRMMEDIKTGKENVSLVLVFKLS